MRTQENWLGEGNTAIKREQMTACMSLECVCNSSLLGKQTVGTGKLREPRETGQMKETIMAGQLKRIWTNLLC